VVSGGAQVPPASSKKRDLLFSVLFVLLVRFVAVFAVALLRDSSFVLGWADFGRVGWVGVQSGVKVESKCHQRPERSANSFY